MTGKHMHVVCYTSMLVGPTVEQQTERESQPCSVSGSASVEDDFFCFDLQLAGTADTRAEVDV